MPTISDDERRTREVSQKCVQKATKGENGVFLEVEITGKATDPEKREAMREMINKLEDKNNEWLNNDD